MISRSGIILLLLLAAGCDRQSPAPIQANQAQADGAQSDETSPDEATSAPAAAARGINRSFKGEAVTAAPFETPGGETVTLASFRGKPVLLNLWATWCAPCVAEMPTLDAAAATLGDTVTVLAVSQDLQGAAKVDPFFAKAKFRALEPYRDQQMALSLAFQANLPTTVLIDKEGREVWRLTGTRDWNSPESRALIAEAT